MASNSDTAYANLNEVFEMDRNRCYSIVKASSNTGEKTSSNIGRTSSSSDRRCLIAIVVLLSVVLLALTAATACIITALVENAKLKAEASSLSANVEFSDEKILKLLDGEMSESRRNYSHLLNILTFISHNFEELLQNFSQLHPQVQQLITKSKCLSLTTACSELVPSCPSDYYWVRASNGSVVRVYCDMTLSCGNITGGWMRVAELDMTDTSQHCPGNLVERNVAGIRHCRVSTVPCTSVANYTTTITSYSSVCGRITAYQVGSTNAFRKYYESNTTTINSNYVDGVSLTHGNPRQHIWTFAAALDRQSDFRNSKCPCLFNRTPPPFVGDDYFCDAGNEDYTSSDTGLQPKSLWDGSDCLCCDNPPWFYKQLPQPTTDDIEMRVCRSESAENIAIELITIYIQ